MLTATSWSTMACRETTFGPTLPTTPWTCADSLLKSMRMSTECDLDWGIFPAERDFEDRLIRPQLAEEDAAKAARRSALRVQRAGAEAEEEVEPETEHDALQRAQDELDAEMARRQADLTRRRRVGPRRRLLEWPNRMQSAENSISTIRASSELEDICTCRA